MLIAGTLHPQQLSDKETADAIALGRSCKAPIIHFDAPEYDLYVETPFGHAALIAAVAVVNRESIDAPGIRRAMMAPAAIWLTRKLGGATMPTVDRIAVQPLRGAEIRASAERRDRLFAGSLPSHGIVDSLRTRLRQYEFPSLPSGDFDVVVHFDHGIRRYRVGHTERETVIAVCNTWM